MADTRKSYAAIIAGTLGLVVVVTAVYCSTLRSRKYPTMTIAESTSNNSDHDHTGITSSHGDQESTTNRSSIEEPVDAAPLSMKPAASGSKALLVCADGNVDASWLAKFAAESKSAGATVDLCPLNSERLRSHASTAGGTYDFVVVEALGVNEDSGVVLGEVLKLLKPSGKVAAVVVEDSDGVGGELVTKRALTFAGFLSVTAYPGESRLVTGERPEWAMGASAPVRLTFRKPVTVSADSNDASDEAKGKGNAASEDGGTSKWKVSLDDDDVGLANGGGDDDLVDEDALLEASAPVKRASEQSAGGCSTRRRACKSCSCGRAEMEQAGTLPGPPASVDDMDDALTSACGNCSRGDAFRCAGCPFLGKPAFEKGQERLVMLADLDAQQDV